MAGSNLGTGHHLQAISWSILQSRTASVAALWSSAMHASINRRALAVITFTAIPAGQQIARSIAQFAVPKVSCGHFDSPA
jgi:hypothetical protein